MKKIALFIAAAAAFVSCSKDNVGSVNDADSVSKDAVTVSVKAVAPGNATKTHFGELADNSYPVLWDESDAIKVVESYLKKDQSERTYLEAVQSSNIEVGTGAKSAAFSVTLGELQSEGADFRYKAVYPAAALQSVDADGNLVVSIPSAQTCDGKVDPAASVIVADQSSRESTTRPTADDEEGIPFTFNHAVAYACVSLKNVAYSTTSVTFQASGKNLAGQLNCGSAAVTEGSDDIIVTLPAAKSGSFDVWFASIPAENITGLKVTCSTADGKKLERTVSKEIALKKGRVAKFGVDMLSAFTPDEIYISGPSTDFSTSTRNTDNRFTKNDDGTYSWRGNLYTLGQLTHSFNNTYGIALYTNSDYIPSISASGFVPVTLDGNTAVTPYIIRDSDDAEDNKFYIGKTGVYDVVVNPAEGIVTWTRVTDVEKTFDKMWIVGSGVSSWDSSNNIFTDPKEMTKEADGTFTWTGNLSTKKFKFVGPGKTGEPGINPNPCFLHDSSSSDSWAVFYTRTGNPDNDDQDFGTFTKNGYKFNVTEAGKYKIVLNPDVNAPTVTVTKVTE